MKSITLGAALLLTAAALPTHASAADLGGDCCADLEERIAELEATTARKGNRKVSLTVYGQVNEAVSWWDDGVESNVYQVTNDTSRSRFGFKGHAKINDDLYAGFRIEIGIRTARQGRVTADSDDGGAGLDLRHTSWTLGSKTYGSVTVGETSFATDGVTQVQLANIKHFANQDIFDANADFQIRSSRNSGPGIGITWEEAVQVLEPGEGSRGNLVRYDTPSIAGFHFSAAWGEDDIWNVALKYAGEFNGLKIAGAIGYGEATEVDEECAQFGAGSSDSKCQELGLSASILHVPSGLFLTGAYGYREDDTRTRALALAGLNGDDRTEFYHIQGGIERKWNALGKTTIFGGYQYRDGGTPVDPGNGALLVANDGLAGGTVINTEVQFWEIDINQQVSAAALDLYLHYKNYDADITTTGGALATEQWQTVIGGALIKF